MSNELCTYCGSPLKFCEAGEYCSNPDCGYIDGHYIPRPKRAAWKQCDGYLEIEGLDCLISLEPRPKYCDRGNFVAKIMLKPNGNAMRLDLDAADCWPRYFMNLDRAKAEIEDWLCKRKQAVESK